MFAPLSHEQAPDLGTPPWPSGLTREGSDLLFCGRSLADLAANGTPLYLVDEAEVRRRAATWVEAIGDGDVYYAGKAFLTPTIARWVSEEGLRIDTASEGELRTALAGGVPGENIGLHGNNKSADLITLALENSVGRIVVDSVAEVALVASVARDLGVVAPCFIRVTTGVHAGGHEFIATAHEDQKFGLSLTGPAYEAARLIAASEHLNLVGIHSHIGSQILDPAGFIAAAKVVMEFVANLAGEGIEIDEIDLGGGYGIQYTGLDSAPVQPAAMMTEIRSAMESLTDGELPRLSIEPGRSIIGPAGITLYTVGTVKPVQTGEGIRLYVSVDGGMSDNIRPALYDANYTAMIERESDAEYVPARVVGMHCESGDIVVRDVALPADIHAGDRLIVAATGAYGRVMASNYNLVRRPGVLGVGPSGSTWLVRPESWEDVLGQLG